MPSASAGSWHRMPPDRREPYLWSSIADDRACAPKHDVFPVTLAMSAAPAGTEEAPLPRFSHVYARLLPFQREGVDWAIKERAGRCLIADEMGLGKTVWRPLPRSRVYAARS